MKIKLSPSIAAQRILSESGQTRPPTDLNKILELFPDLNVSIASLDGEGAYVDLGALGGEILLKKETRRTRQRFTLAHEIGHHVLIHRASIAGHDEGDSATHRAIERWCNSFAANIIIPSHAFTSTTSAQELLRSQNIYTYLVNLTDIFDCSLQLICIRIVELIPVSIFFVDMNDLTKCFDFPNLKYHELTWKSEIYEYLQDALESNQSCGIFRIENSIYAFDLIRKNSNSSFFIVATGLNKYL